MRYKQVVVIQCAYDKDSRDTTDVLMGLGRYTILRAGGAVGFYAVCGAIRFLGYGVVEAKRFALDEFAAAANCLSQAVENGYRLFPGDTCV